MSVIVAIDPGTTESAIVIFDGQRVRYAAKMPNEDLRSTLPKMLIDSDRVVIEMIASYGMAVGKDVFETCVWIGRFMQSCPRPDDVQLVYRRDVKMHLCGSPRAKDGNIRQALIDLLGAPGTKKDPGPTYGIAGDMWAALAVAVTASAA
jgi:hypothetical protein